MANNIVEAWISRAKEKYGTVQAGVDHMNLVCNAKMQTGSIYAMKNGKKNVPECIHFHMLNDVLLTELENANFEIGLGNFEQLRDSLSLPRRCK